MALGRRKVPTPALDPPTVNLWMTKPMRGHTCSVYSYTDNS